MVFRREIEIIQLVSLVLLLSLTTDVTVAETHQDICIERIVKILKAGLMPDVTNCEFPVEFSELARGGCVSRPIAGGLGIQMHINNFSDYISFTQCDLEVFCNFFKVVVVLLVHRKEIQLPRKYAGKMPWALPDSNISEYKPSIKVQTNISRKVFHGSGSEQQSSSKNSNFLLYFGICCLLLLGFVCCAAVLPPDRVQHFVHGQQIDAATAVDVTVTTVPTSGGHKYCQFYSFGAAASAFGLVIFLILYLRQRFFKH